MLNAIFAATTTDLGKTFGSPWGRSLDLGDLIGIIINGGITLGGVIVLFTFIFGGISVIRGAGNNDPKAAAAGRQALTYAVVGFVVVFTAYWVIRILEIVTGAAFLTNPGSF